MNLRSLRSSEGSKERPIPYGYGFHWVTCPNYFFEIMGWVILSILSLSFPCK